MTEPKFGHIITDQDCRERDAIHVATCAVTANERLSPGTHVGLLGKGSDTAGTAGKHIGIVDPYLPGPVFPGDRFWLFLYPGSITSLRHAWTHPAFEERPAEAKSGSEAWLKDYAEGLRLSYADLMDGADYWLKCGGYLCDGGKLEGVSTSDEFWSHYEIVRSLQPGSVPRENFFTCSC